MRRAWTFRRFLLSIAGVACLAGLSVAADRLTPPQPPPDNDGLELNQPSAGALRPALIQVVPNGPVLVTPNDEESAVGEPVLTDSADPVSVFPEPILARPIQAAPPALQPFDPQPRIEPYQSDAYTPQPYVAQPLAIYPENIAPASQNAPDGAGTYWDSCVTPLQVSPEGQEGAATNCSCCCLPTWTVRGEALLWGRAGGTSVPLVTAPVIINSGDLDFGWRVGPRITAIRHGIFNSCWDFELAYLGIDGWEDQIAVADADDLQTVPPIFVGGVVPFTTTYNSSLHSLEANARRTTRDWATWIVGFRALQVSESLNSNFGGVATHLVQTTNHLYGVQLGLDLRMLNTQCWSVNVVGKAGVYGNSADQTTTTTGVGGALPFISYTGTDTSFVGELGFNANYRVTDRLTLIAGYNLLWVTDVALAPDQLANTDIATGIGGLDSRGSVMYYGVNLGAQYTW